jgi:alkaline phosphatase
MKKSIKIILSLVLVLTLTSSIVFAQTYTVQEGDLLWKIADNFGVELDTLVEVNDIDNANLIYPGDELTIPGTETATTATATPKYVFYFIGDGLGAAQRELAEMYLQEEQNDLSAQLVMNSFDEAGLNSTWCSDTLVTDSAAAGTALACGYKTNKGVISQDVDGNDLTTLVEEAEKAGMATGIITTTRITHATPAVFASHNIDRNDENAIAYDFLDSGVDFFAGGGARYFVPQDFEPIIDATGTTIKSKRTDDIDLMAEFSDLGYEVYYGEEGTTNFKNMDTSTVEKVFAPLTYSHMPYEIDRMNLYPELPSLAEMTELGIEVLEKDEDGFFIMIEGGRIDHACHANDAAATLYDTLAFDAAVGEAYDFYMAHPDETLIVVVGDHETGGLGLGFDLQGYFMDLSPLSEQTASVEDRLIYGDLLYTGDRTAYMTMLGEEFGLTDLSDYEMALLTAGMDKSDEGITTGYYGNDSAAMAVTQIIASRINVNWTTTIHTGTMIPFTAQGVCADQFNGYIDNTDIALTLADILGFDL